MISKTSKCSPHMARSLVGISSRPALAVLSILPILPILSILPIAIASLAIVVGIDPAAAATQSGTTSDFVIVPTKPSNPADKTSSPTPAPSGSDSSNSSNSSNSIVFFDPEEAFRPILDAWASAPKKTPFDSEKDWKDKLSDGTDPNKVYYVKVRVHPLGIDKPSSLGERMLGINSDYSSFDQAKYISYQYDLKKKRLTLIGGKDPSPGIENIPRGATPLELDEAITALSSYESNNGFGAKVTVSKHEEKQWVVNILNKGAAGKLNIFSDKYHFFAASIGVEPDAGKTLVDDLAFVVGLKGLSAKTSFTESDHHSPTFDDPYEVTYTQYVFNATLDSVYVVDCDKGAILGKWMVPAK